MNKFKSSEDYLERIYVLKKENKTLRAIDLAKDLGFSKPSVSVALKKLKANNFITVCDETGNIELTKRGLELASYVYEKQVNIEKTNEREESIKNSILGTESLKLKKPRKKKKYVLLTKDQKELLDLTKSLDGIEVKIVDKNKEEKEN